MLALLGSVTLVGVNISTVSVAFHRVRRGQPRVQPVVLSVTVLTVILAVALLIGGIQLFRRRNGARAAIAISCGLLIAVGIGALALRLSVNGFGYLEWYYSQHPSALILPVVVCILFPLVTMILVLLPSTKTKRWCQAGQTNAGGHPSPYR